MGSEESFSFYDRQAVIKTRKEIPKNTFEVTKTEIFFEANLRFIKNLKEKDSPLLVILPEEYSDKKQTELIVDVLGELTFKKIEEVKDEKYSGIIKDRYILSLFVEELYDYWRSYERFFIYYIEDQGKFDPHAPYAHFNEKVETINHLVRKTYRDIAYNITGELLRIYRQVPAACQVGLVVMKENNFLPLAKEYSILKNIYFIKQVLINPPLIINPPTNTRNGEFKKVHSNPLEKVSIEDKDYLCYPAKVGNLLIQFYFHNKFIGIGTAVANLFDLAGRPDILKKPDAVFIFGVEDTSLSHFDSKTVFYEDEKNDILVAACPRNDEFGYFGYIKKMILTLHNIVMMRRGRMPVHGAMVNISMKNKKSANIVIWGDSGAGKSETIEAFRKLSGKYLRDIKIIFDDMGSLEISESGSGIKAYGTETGAFVRLDDLSPEYAFGSIDRSIIMNPQKTNARAVLPITTMHEVLYGYDVDYILYANNYEQIDEYHTIFERINSKEKAMEIFKHGARFAKGTTTEKGLVHTYYSNIFGPSQYKAVHDIIAENFFRKMYSSDKIKVGIIRTRLGIPGYESKGPEEAAKALFEEINNN